MEDLSDLKDTDGAVQGLVLEDMEERIQENLDLRRDKTLLNEAFVMDAENVDANDKFFGMVEGLNLLSPEAAVGGLYVETKPRLRLARLGI